MDLREKIDEELIETGLFDTNSEIERAFVKQTTDRILSAFKEAMEGVIGEDEEIKLLDMDTLTKGLNNDRSVRNQLKATQRQRLHILIKGGGE